MNRLSHSHTLAQKLARSACILVQGTVVASSVFLAQSNNVLAHTEHRTPISSGNLLTTVLPQDPGKPEFRNPHNWGPVNPAEVNALVGRPNPSRSKQCVVDFNADDAIALSEHSLWFDRFYIPWWQSCDNQRFVDIRPLKYNHFHLGFANEHVEPCASNEQAFPSYVDDVFNCEFIVLTDEPRTHLTTHSAESMLRVRMYDSTGTNREPFNLNSIRVVGNSAIDVCFNHSMQPHTEWKAGQTPAEGEQAGWYCWEGIGEGNWNLSPWISNVVDVRIVGTNGGNFSVDDLVFEW